MDKKFQVFKINLLELTAVKSPVLSREYLTSALNGLTNSPKILALTKGDPFQFYVLQNDEKAGGKCSLAHFCSV